MQHRICGQLAIDAWDYLPVLASFENKILQKQFNCYSLSLPWIFRSFETVAFILRTNTVYSGTVINL